jgi:hypothetical protein
MEVLQIQQNQKENTAREKRIWIRKEQKMVERCVLVVRKDQGQEHM